MDKEDRCVVVKKNINIFFFYILQFFFRLNVNLKYMYFLLVIGIFILFFSV